LLCSFISAPAYAQKLSSADHKAETILRFFDYFDWPESVNLKSYQLGIYKGGDEISQILLALGNSHRAKGRIIDVSLVETNTDLSSYELIYIPQLYSHELTAIARSTRRSGTLLVSNGANDQRNQMINFNHGSDNFEMNRTNITYESLTIDDAILKLGGTELDIATLYKEMEDELEGLKVGLEGTRRQFLLQNEEIAFLRQQATRAELNISNMREETHALEEQVDQKNDELQQAQQDVDALRQSLDNGQQELEKLQTELERSRTAFNAEIKKLTLLEQRLSDKSNEAEQQEQIILKNERRISKQTATLQSQAVSLLEQNTVISSQKNWLLAAAVAIIAILLLLGRIIQIGRKMRLLNADLSIAKSELEVRVKERTLELERATNDAIQASKAKSEFLSNMSHELRTPLNAIIGFSAMLQDKIYGDIGDERYAEYAALINTSGDHLLSIINEILDLTRIETGKLNLDESAFNPVNAIHECLSIISTTTNAKNQKVVFKADKTLAFLKADHRLFCQMLLNLLGNASKFSPEHSTITVTLTVHLVDGLTLSVSDQGIGIAADKIAEIKEPFVQVEKALNRNYHGVGLGLTLVSSMISLHCGTLGIESTEDVGTTVTLNFPSFRVVNKPEASSKTIY